MEVLANSTVLNSTAELGAWKGPPVAFVSVCFAIIIFIGVVGNGLLIFTVAMNKGMYSVPNIYLVSLAIGDLAVLIFSVPFRMLLYLYQGWVYGATMCHIFEFIIHLSQGVSIFTLTALAGDRFVAIVMPIQTFLWFSKKRAIFISLSIWVISFLFALPDIITSDIVTAKAGFKTCVVYAIFANGRFDDHHPYVLSRRIMNFCVYFVLPLFIISTFYIAIAVSLCRSNDITVRNTLRVSQTKSWEKQVMARKKIAKIILVITLLFVLCWAPRYVQVFLSGYHDPPLHFSRMRHFKTASYILSFLNSCVNPPSLYIMSTDFKRLFNHYLFGRCFKSMRLSKYHRNSVTSSNINTNFTNVAISFEDLALK